METGGKILFEHMQAIFSWILMMMMMVVPIRRNTDVNILKTVQKIILPQNIIKASFIMK